MTICMFSLETGIKILVVSYQTFKTCIIFPSSFTFYVYQNTNNVSLSLMDVDRLM